MTAAPTVCLEVRDLAKSYGRLQVIKDLSFAVPKGEALGIIGPNGAGKTTLFHLLGGTVKPDRGDVLLNGHRVTGLAAHRRCQLGLARTFQIPQPFIQMTVFENVLLAAERVTHPTSSSAKERAAAVLARVRLYDERNRLAGSLTLLQRKRLELGRALASDPVVLLIDELAGGLTDPEMVEFVALLDHLRSAGVTLLWIEHAVHALASFVDRLLAINFGELLVVGAAREVLAHDQVRQVYLGVEE